MKHLKKFNESNSYEEELKDFCEGYLAYLLDDGDYELFTYTYAKFLLEGQMHFKILFCEKDRSYIEWDNIKDHFIPFLSMLDRSYNIESGEIYDEKAIDIDGKEYLISDLIDDNIYQPLRGDGNVSKFRFKYINIYIKK